MNNTSGAANGNTASATRPAQTSNIPPVSSAHGSNPTGGAPASGNAGSAAKPTGIDTAALDAKIEKADAKAKASGATQADKDAAAAAYVERGNVYYSAGQPMLYKFALGDFRRALRYQPGNEEARAKKDQIIDIYENSLKRPVPTNGLEP